jgi:hypothetical protein
MNCELGENLQQEVKVLKLHSHIKAKVYFNNARSYERILENTHSK